MEKRKLQNQKVLESCLGLKAKVCSGLLDAQDSPRTEVQGFQESRHKKIKKFEDIKRLELGDIVEIENYGKAVYYAASMVGLTFMGRVKDRDAIYELETSREHITPRQNGSMAFSTTLSERIYHEDHSKISSYDDRDMILMRAGL